MGAAGARRPPRPGHGGPDAAERAGRSETRQYGAVITTPSSPCVPAGGPWVIRSGPQPDSTHARNAPDEALTSNRQRQQVLQVCAHRRLRRRVVRAWPHPCTLPVTSIRPRGSACHALRRCRAIAWSRHWPRASRRWPRRRQDGHVATSGAQPPHPLDQVEHVLAAPSVVACLGHRPVRPPAQALPHAQATIAVQVGGQDRVFAAWISSASSNGPVRLRRSARSPTSSGISRVPCFSPSTRRRSSMQPATPSTASRRPLSDGVSCACTPDARGSIIATRRMPALHRIAGLHGCCRGASVLAATACFKHASTRALAYWGRIPAFHPRPQPSLAGALHRRQNPAVHPRSQPCRMYARRRCRCWS